jgi:hypothetical protein
MLHASTDAPRPVEWGTWMHLAARGAAVMWLDERGHQGSSALPQLATILGSIHEVGNQNRLPMLSPLIAIVQRLPMAWLALSENWAHVVGHCEAF